MSVTPVYAAILTLLFVVLSLRVIFSRRSGGTSLGDGGDDQLLRRIRVHGNFAEYVPLALLLMALMELRGLPRPYLHLVGLPLISGRLLHAYGVSLGVGWARVAGMALTFATLVAAALANLGMLPL
ncbi:MAG: MAPEG family protein [Hyphomicrobiaceae bacterium]